MSEVPTAVDAASPAAFDGSVVKSGIDVVSISRIEELRRRDGVDFVRRVFTDDEIDYCEATAYPAEHYAGRWCVKEAVRKVLDRPGRVPFREIAVEKEASKPTLGVGEVARDELEATLGAELTDDRVDTAVSLSHDRTSDTAVGTVTVLKCECGRDGNQV